MKTKWKIVLGVTAVAVTAGVVVGGIQYSKRGIVTVQTGRANRQDLVSLVTASGEIKPRNYYNVGNAGAIADAQLVPSGFVLNAANDASDNRLMNRIFQITQQGGFYTVEALSRNLTTENGEVDPRSATHETETRPADARSAIWVAEKYPAQGSPTPIAPTIWCATSPASTGSAASSASTSCCTRACGCSSAPATRIRR